MYETFDGGSRYVAFDRIYYLSCIFHDIYIYTQTHIYIHIYTHICTLVVFRFIAKNLHLDMSRQISKWRKKDYYINNKRSLDDFATRFSNRLIL